MSMTELRREIEHAEHLASSLSAQCTLFDGYYDDNLGLAQAQLDPDCFFTSWNEIFEKVDELYGFLKQLVKRMYAVEGG